MGLFERRSASPCPAACRSRRRLAGAAQSPPSDADLAQQLSNPVASLVSVPLQFNWDQPVGPDDDSRFTLNFQPVVPIGLNDDWNMIARWIMPYVAQPRLFEGRPTSGLSDIVASAFFSPARPGAIIWGVGPVLMLPTTADPLLGSGKWGSRPDCRAADHQGPMDSRRARQSSLVVCR